MPKIIEYKKVITQQNTYELREVEGTELCTRGLEPATSCIPSGRLLDPYPLFCFLRI